MHPICALGSGLVRMEIKHEDVHMRSYCQRHKVNLGATANDASAPQRRAAFDRMRLCVAPAEAPWSPGRARALLTVRPKAEHARRPKASRALQAARSGASGAARGQAVDGVGAGTASAAADGGAALPRVGAGPLAGAAGGGGLSHEPTMPQSGRHSTAASGRVNAALWAPLEPFFAPLSDESISHALLDHGGATGRSQTVAVADYVDRVRQAFGDGVSAKSATCDGTRAGAAFSAQFDWGASSAMDAQCYGCQRPGSPSQLCESCVEPRSVQACITANGATMLAHVTVAPNKRMQPPAQPAQGPHRNSSVPTTWLGGARQSGITCGAPSSELLPPMAAGDLQCLEGLAEAALSAAQWTLPAAANVARVPAEQTADANYTKEQLFGLVDAESVKRADAHLAFLESAVLSPISAVSLQELSQLARAALQRLLSADCGHGLWLAQVLKQFGWDGQTDCFTQLETIRDSSDLASRLAKGMVAFGDQQSRHHVVGADVASFRQSEEDAGMSQLTEIEQQLCTATEKFSARAAANTRSICQLRAQAAGARTAGNPDEQRALFRATEQRQIRRQKWASVRSTVFRGMRDAEWCARGSAGGNDDDAACCVCFDLESDEDNPIVFCEGCNIGVHKICYGMPNVPDADWFCDRCAAGKQKAQLCCVWCGLDGGAFKRLASNGWSHVFCSLWHSEIPLAATIGHGQLVVPRSALHHNAKSSSKPQPHPSCLFCGKAHGNVVECAHDGCPRRFHHLCAWFEGVYVEVRDSVTAEFELSIGMFCSQHVPQHVKRSATQQKSLRGRGRSDQSSRRRARSVASGRSPARSMQISSELDPYPEGMCAVCCSSVAEPANEIMQCCVCKLSAHQACYGVATIPEDRETWKCSVCSAGIDFATVECDLCPRRGGLFKKTTSNGWAHVICALWIPEVHIEDTAAMEPIVTTTLTKERRRLRCVVCGIRYGGCVQCADKCFVAFHPTCAFFSQFYMTWDEEASGVVARAYCQSHTQNVRDHGRAETPLPEEYQELRTLRREFERLRLLVDMVQRRERVKRQLTTTRVAALQQYCLAGAESHPHSDERGQPATTDTPVGSSTSKLKRCKQSEPS